MKPLGDIKPMFPGMHVLSAGDWNLVVETVKLLRNNFSVDVPLTLQVTATGIHIGFDATGLLPTGTKGEMLVHNGIDWVVLEVPGVPSIMYFDIVSGLPSWIPTAVNCPGDATTTTAAATTTTA